MFQNGTLHNSTVHTGMFQNGTLKTWYIAELYSIVTVSTWLVVCEA